MPALPFTIALGRPSRSELLSLAGAALLVGSAAAWAITSAHPARPQPAADPPPAIASLEVASEPPGAELSIDGQSRGNTPTTVEVVPSGHVVALTAKDAVDETRTTEVDSAGTRLQIGLWRAHPSVAYLKPPLPGAAVSDARFLADGRLALELTLPDRERQAWTLDPDAHFATQRLGDISGTAPLRARPDGDVVATLRPRANQPTVPTVAAFSDHSAAGEVWLAPVHSDSSPRPVWTAPDRTEELVDLEWAPDGQHLIVVGRQTVSGGAARTAIHWLDSNTGEAQDLALLPSEVAPATYVWNTDGQNVGFVVHTASLAAVCTLSVAGNFRYLGDLRHDGLLGPPVAPVAWAPDGRVVYGALVGQTPASNPNTPFSSNPAGLFLADPPDAPGRAFSSTPAVAPFWRPDGRLLAIGVASGQEAGLRLRDVDAQGNARDLASVDVPAPGPTAYGVRWDLAHNRALIITNRGSGSGPVHDYWLVDFSWGTTQ